MKRILLACAFVLSTSAHAEFFSGNDLLAKLQSQSQVDKTLALGYVIGVADAAQGAVVCLPSAATAGQITDLVRAWLESAPAVRHNTADSLVVHVLKTAWPCANKPKRSDV